MCNRSAQSTAIPAGASFDEVVLPHLESAHRLARWITRNEHDAEDVVQEASLRAFRYFRTFGGGNGRAWFLRIVRNTSHGWLGTRRHVDPFDEELHSGDRAVLDPEMLMLRTSDATLIDRTIGNLPKRFRELLVLREIEGLSYQELAEAMDIPIGTVMSGLSRARRALRGALDAELVGKGCEPRAAAVNSRVDWSHRGRRRSRAAVKEYAHAAHGHVNERPHVGRRALGDIVTGAEECA